jgi:Rad3-related DNA helicase
MSGVRQFKVVGGTEVAKFLVSNREVDVIEGPLGSGKTRALCARIMRHAQEQRVSRSLRRAH